MLENVVIIGAGNLATQLALAFNENNIPVRQIYSRTIESASELAKKVNAEFTNDLNSLFPTADLYVVAVKDTAIQEVMENLSLDEDRLIVHTAGSVPMEVLAGFTKNFGVFYPLQTFSKSRKVDFSVIPICLEANHPSNLDKLQNLAFRLSGTVRQLNSEERKTLHLAAVFANNFVNHFYAIAAELIDERKMSFDLLKPLILETAAKIVALHPIEAQTGPARRNDLNAINAQLNLLEDQPEFRKIYSFVSESIYQHYQNQPHDIL